ncbi:hypothetical protein HD554DRAFT_960495 [Boletus coccyginus]|nr:hypothetical protein HD554DRAFT_960495 [Boletus coccyginus]
MPKAAPRAPSQPTATVSRASEQVETADLEVNPSDYIDDPEPIAKGFGGRPGDDRLPRLAIRCHRRDDTSKTNVFRCVGTSAGCTTAWKTKNRVKRWIMSHAATCEHVPHELTEDLDRFFFN